MKHETQRSVLGLFCCLVQPIFIFIYFPLPIEYFSKVTTTKRIP